jgi:hypothetical protein
MQTGDLVTNRLTRILGLIALLFCTPYASHANAGTPLMWAGMLHLVFGNAIIGVFEGLILGWIFKLKKWLCVLVMIPANYFSAWVGGLFLNEEITAALPLNLYNAWHWIWMMVVLTFLITLIFEWPFLFFCLRKEQGKFKKSIQGNLLVNSLSYILLFSWYWLASGMALYTKMNIVQPSEIPFSKAVVVYFIANTNAVCRLDLHTREMEKIWPIETDRDDRLFIKPSTFGSRNWDIFDSSTKSLICSNLEVAAVQAERDTYDAERIEGTWFNFGNVAKLGSVDKTDWHFETGFWPIEGLRGENQKTGEKIYFSLETPFVSWIIRNATQLPDNRVVFQLGDDQICLLEPSTKKIALIARGQGPVVVLPKEK